ncbi:amidohydrolase [Planifilum fimeticola]|uniref:Amidohydrolase n=1 Tax=Planifilum fimeticola TaxID=201975 RepID=A0A2T0LGL1_9BACL|nr:amidohydrolase [Planifilum fimeticola]
MNPAVKKLEPIIMEIFQHLHNHPEISWQEYGTTSYVAGLLERHGYRTRRFEDCTGVVGEIGSGRPVVALRADMDALWQEVDGRFQANHSCGHDAHMTMVLGTILLFQRMGYYPPGTFRVIFQPAEEKGTGALRMVEKQVIRDADYLYGVHLRPVQELKNGTAAPAILHGAARFITGEIIGSEAHAARPHLGINTIEVGASFVQELSRIRLDPMVPHSVKMTRFTAGSESGNIIPGRARFSLDLRAQTNRIMDGTDFARSPHREKFGALAPCGNPPHRHGLHGRGGTERRGGTADGTSDPGCARPRAAGGTDRDARRGGLSLLPPEKPPAESHDVGSRLRFAPGIAPPANDL